MFCPPKNSKHYKELASVTGHAIAHDIYFKNQGYPIDTTSKGEPSPIFKELEENFGRRRAISMMAKTFTESFDRIANHQSIENAVLNDSDNVLFPDGTLIHLGDRSAFTEQKERYIAMSEYVHTAHHINILLDSMKRVLPGVNIISETFETLRGTKHEGENAWVDHEGVHFNVQRMHYSSPVHELSHIWMAYLKEYNEGAYNAFIQAVENSIDTNRKLFDKLRAGYPLLTDNQLLHEYAATVAGFVSEDAIRDHAFKKNVYLTDNESRSILQKVSDAIHRFFDAVRELINNIMGFKDSHISRLNFATATIEDVFRALTRDLIEANPILGLSASESKSLLDTYYSGEYHEAQQDRFAHIKDIENISDIAPYVANNEEVDILDKDPFSNANFVDRYADILMGRIRKGTTEDYMYVFSEKYVFPKSMDANGRKNLIKSDIMPRISEITNSFNENIKNVINTVIQNPKTAIEEAIKDSFTNMKLSYAMMDDIIKAVGHVVSFGLAEGAMNYSELKDHPTYSFLYKGMIEGYDPLVVFYKTSDAEKTIEVSLVDLTSRMLGRGDNQLSSGELYLGSAFGYRGNMTYGNRKADIRKVVLATTIAGMTQLAKEKGVKLRIRKAGVLGFNGRLVQPHMITSFKEAFANARELFGLEYVTSRISDLSSDKGWFMNLLADDTAWNSKTILQSAKDQLEVFYSTYYIEKGLTEEQRDTFMDRTASWGQYQALLDRQQHLERTMRRDQLRNDEEYTLITMYLLNFRYNIDLENSQVDDINKVWMRVTNPHNMKNDIAELYNITAEETKSVTMMKSFKRYQEFDRLLEAAEKSHGRSLSGINAPEKVFDRLFVKGKVILEEDSRKHKKGDVIDVNLKFWIHGSYDTAAAKKAGLTKEDIELADYIANTIYEITLEKMLHENKKLSNPLDEDEVKKRLEEQYDLRNGRIPVVPKTYSELFRSSEFMKAFKKYYQKVGTAALIGGEIDATKYRFDDKNFQDVYSVFQNQHDTNNTLKLLTLRPVDGSETTFSVRNYDSFEGTTSNLQMLFKMFVHDGIRKMEIENRLIPVYNQALQFIHIAEMNNQPQDVLKQFLIEYNTRIIGRANMDQDKAFAAKMRTAMAMYSYVSLAYRPVVWFRSAYYNTQNAVLTTVATAAANATTPEDQKLKLPTPKHFAKANMLMARDFSKIWNLALQMNLLFPSEMEAIESVFLNKIDRNPFKSSMGHIGNKLTDLMARMATMVAFMVRDGSYDAHIYDPITETFKYDKTKDKRVWENGKFKSKEAEILHNDVVAYQIHQGLITSEDQMQFGYTNEEINSRMKWYADKFIIGSMDEYQRTLLGTQWLGQMALQFRNYATDKIFNIVGSERFSYHGAGRVVTIDNEGHARVVREQITNIGSTAAIWKLAKHVVDIVKRKDNSVEELKETWNNPMIKMMVFRGMNAAIMFTGIMALMYLFKESLSDRDRKKLVFTWGNLMLAQEYNDVSAQVLPIAGMLDTMWSIMVGKAKWNKLIRYIGPVYDGLYVYDFLTGENPLETTTQQEKRKKREAEAKKKAEQQN